MQSTTAQRVEGELTVQISSLRADLAICYAAAVARAGCYGEAEAVLAAASATTTIAGLDLLARIRAQQGQLSEAALLWRQMGQLCPTGAASDEGLARIYQRSRVWRSWPLLAAVLVMGVVAATAWFTARSVRRSIERVTNDRQVSVSNLVSAAPAPQSSEHPNPPSFSLPGTLVEHEGDETIVAFSSDLFSRGVVLTPEGKSMLATVGHELAAAPGALAVTIVGVTDDIPVIPGSIYRDNTALAFARAVTALAVLRDSAEFDPVAFVLRSAGQRDQRIRDLSAGRSVVFRIAATRS